LEYFGYRREEFRDELGNLAFPTRLDAYYVQTYKAYQAKLNGVLSNHVKYMEKFYGEPPSFAEFAAKVAPLFLAYYYARAKAFFG
jgi:hypothetical protein